MFSKFFRRPSHTTVVAYLALFAALGGTSYAAVKLPKNSVGGAQIKKNAVTGAKVKNSSLGPSDIKNGSLLKADFKAGQLPAGAQGPQGPPGPTGASGPVGPDGTINVLARVGADAARTLQPNVVGYPTQNRGIVQANVVAGDGGAATGTTCFNLSSFPVSAQVSLDNADAGAADRNLIASVSIDRGEDLGDCPATHNDARVRIVDGNTGAAQDGRFFVWFEL